MYWTLILIQTVRMVNSFPLVESQHGLVEVMQSNPLQWAGYVQARIFHFVSLVVGVIHFTDQHITTSVCSLLFCCCFCSLRLFLSQEQRWECRCVLSTWCFTRTGRRWSLFHRQVVKDGEQSTTVPIQSYCCLASSEGNYASEMDNPC